MNAAELWLKYAKTGWSGDADAMGEEDFIAAMAEVREAYAGEAKPDGKTWLCGECKKTVQNDILPPFGCPHCHAYHWSFLPNPGASPSDDMVKVLSGLVSWMNENSEHCRIDCEHMDCAEARNALEPAERILKTLK